MHETWRNYAAERRSVLERKRCKDAQTKSSRAEAVEHALIFLRLEECARGMEQSANYAAATGAHTLLSREGYAEDMEQRRNYVAALDTQSKSST